MILVESGIIKYVAGNSVPLFCLSLGYAAITMGMCDYFVQNLAVNIMGGTSQGKTVSEKVPVSMIGPPNYLIQLSGTARSLKDMPRLHNHTLVVMDDISKLGDEGPRFAKEFSFDFEGGQQRSRLRTTGEQRHRDEWKTLALLSNEKSSVDMIKYDQLQGGHFVRFIDIPVENFGTYGVFENLHGVNNGKLFSQLLERNTSKYYGIGLEHFIKQLQDKWDESRKYLNERKGLFYRVLVQGREISNEVGRVLEVFSHVIASAELATKLGVHGDYIKPNEMMVACKNVIYK